MPRCKFAAWLAPPSSCVAVVGASGWVGMALVDQILAADPDLTPARLRLFGSRSRTLTVRGRELSIEPLSPSPDALGDGDWLVLHAGIIGADRVEGGDLAEVRRRNDAMLEHVFALAESGETQRLAVFSSGAAARPDAGGAAKQAYGWMKRDHEVETANWSARTGRSVLIPRIFSLGGPYINHTEAYALGDFILQCARHGRIVIGAGVPVIRSFVHVLDAARVVLDMAVDEAESDEPFDICLGRTTELNALAEAVALALGVEPVIDRPSIATTGGDVYVGASARFQAALSRRGETPASLSRIIDDTVGYLREIGEMPVGASIGRDDP
jgi:nucleoside-diphosphate-sugar epimerase